MSNEDRITLIAEIAALIDPEIELVGPQGEISNAEFLRPRKSILTITGTCCAVLPNEALLDSAIGRYRSSYYKDEVEESAALMELLLMNHPFLDGNKRLAVSAAFLSLMANGHAARLDEMETYDFILNALETGGASKEALADWIRGKIGPR